MTGTIIIYRTKDGICRSTVFPNADEDEALQLFLKAWSDRNTPIAYSFTGNIYLSYPCYRIDLPDTPAYTLTTEPWKP